MFWFYEYLWSLVQLVTHYNVVTVQNWRIKKKHWLPFYMLVVPFWYTIESMILTYQPLCQYSVRSVHIDPFKCHSKYFCNKFVYSIWNVLSHQSNRTALKQRKLRFNYSTAYAQLDSRLCNENNTKKYSKEWSKMNYPVWIFLLHFYHSSIFLFIFFMEFAKIIRKSLSFLGSIFKKITLKKISDIIKTVFLSFRSW